jgi:hypothetical protein
MIIDARGLSFSETFKELRDIVYYGGTSRDDVLVFVDAYDNEKLNLIKGFVEILLECITVVAKANGYYVIKIVQEPVARDVEGIS